MAEWNRSGTTRSGEPAAHISEIRFTPPKGKPSKDKPADTSEETKDTDPDTKE